MGKQSAPSPDYSGVIAAQMSRDVAQQQYALGEDQLAFEKDQWSHYKPMIDKVVNTNLGSMQSNADFTKNQQDFYSDNYKPLESTYIDQVKNWDTPAQESQNASAAMGSVATQFEGQRNAALQQLESFGVDPTSTRYAALDIGTRTAQAAAQAGAGTAAIQQTKLQGMGLEAGAINTGRGYAQNQSALTGATTGAGSGASTAALGGLSGAANAMSSTTNFTNAGTNAMGQYTNAVNGFNLAQNQSAQIANQGAAGWGSLAGGIFGSLTSPGFGTSALGMMLADGGPVDTPSPAQAIPAPGATPGATPGGMVPPHASPSGGKAIDDVPAMLTADEFVIPKDVVLWEGQKNLVGLIDKARKGQQQLQQRPDIGGRPAPMQAVPTGAPAFVSRPQQAIPAGFH